MIKSEALKTLAEDTSHLPESSFYLWFTDIMTEESKNELKEKAGQFRSKTIEQIRDCFYYSLELFSKDKSNYLPNQKQSFLEKKIKVKDKIKELVSIHYNKLIEEAITLWKIPKWTNKKHLKKTLQEISNI